MISALLAAQEKEGGCGQNSMKISPQRLQMEENGKKS